MLVQFVFDYCSLDFIFKFFILLPPFCSCHSSLLFAIRGRHRGLSRKTFLYREIATDMVPCLNHFLYGYTHPHRVVEGEGEG